MQITLYPAGSGQLKISGLANHSRIFSIERPQIATDFAEQPFDRFVVKFNIQTAFLKLRCDIIDEYVCIGRGLKHLALGLVELLLRQREFNVHDRLGKGRNTVPQNRNRQKDQKRKANGKGKDTIQLETRLGGVALFHHWVFRQQ